MNAEPQRPKDREGTVSALNAAIDGLNLAKEVASVTPAKAVFGSVSVVLTMIRDAMMNQADYVELGLTCADVCTVLNRGLNGKKLNELNDSVCEAINQLTTAVAAIQRTIAKQSGRNSVSRHFHARNDKEKIAAWRLDLNRILHVFNTELAINTHVAVSDTHAIVSKLERNVANTCVMVSNIHRMMVKGKEGTDSEDRLFQTSTLGESPLPAPKACFGRGELIEKIVGLAENMTPTALIGAGGIGKTSIALTALHHDRIKQRFGHNRRFLRCDQFPATLGHFLRRLSMVIGAGVENPEDMTPLRPFLSSQEVFIVLDNAESILDPGGTDAREIYGAVEELSQFETISLCITSRITTVPRHCKCPTIPALSVEAACDIFYGIYDNGGRSGIISDLLQRLDFHALSTTLLATTALHNRWDYNRLAREWDARRTKILRTAHNESLAATIELSLASPTFRELDPDARDLLGVIAFFPQGIDENNADWLFPTISEREVFDKLCVLSLTHRSDGFITMLAPLRDYLCPKDPRSSPLLCATKDRYFNRVSVPVEPGNPGFEEAEWIRSEDVNVEHLLDVFTSINEDSVNVWDTCGYFMQHLYWHKKRLVMLGPRIEALPDDHPSKPECLFGLSRLFETAGNRVEWKRLLVCILKIWRERGDDFWIADTLRFLAEANRILGFYDEGIQQATEALKVCERRGDTVGQARCLIDLAHLLSDTKQLDAAEEAAYQAIDLLQDTGKEFLVCGSHRLLGNVYHSKGEIEKAVYHYEVALGIASPFSWHNELFWTHYSLAGMFFGEWMLDDANAHIEQAKLHTTNSAYYLARAMELQARIWYHEPWLEEAWSEALYAADIYEKLGAAGDLERCEVLLQRIQQEEENIQVQPQPQPQPQGTNRWHRWLRRVLPPASD